MAIDPSLPTKIASKKLSKQDLKSCEEYQNFLTTHCNEGECAYQIRRCLDASCCPGEELNENLQWLPSPVPDDENPSHYKKLVEVLGNEPTDTWVPSIKYGAPKFDEEEQGCPAAALCGQNIRNNVPLAAVSEECTQRESSS